MIKIFAPSNNINERKYIIEIMLGEFLGLNYNIEFGKYFDYQLHLPNKNNLIVEDHFFKYFVNNLEYLNKDNIPQKIVFAKNEFTPESDIPVIFGNTNFNVKESIIVCGIDIFASSFFMLTRWEEYVNKERDVHGRFLSSSSLAYKQKFLHRPVVNEYVDFLWNMLLYLGFKNRRKKRNFNLYLTHDVDDIKRYYRFKTVCHESLKYIIKQKLLIKGLLNILIFLLIKSKIIKDPYDTFADLLDIAEKNGLKSYFFFMAKGTTTFENRYNLNDKQVKNIIKKIKEKGHFIGIHPSYNAYNNFEQFKKEKNELENSIHQNVLFGRDHYLRFEIPTTWQIWEDNNMLWDSTLCYADRPGFRCGVCYEFSVFNVVTMKKLKLKEKPLIVMDGNFITYHPDITPAMMENRIICLMDKVKKYNGEFILLWHNSSFNLNPWKNYQYIYSRVIAENIKKKV